MVFSAYKVNFDARPNLDDVEEKVRQETRRLEKDLLPVIQQVLDLHWLLFQQRGQFLLTEDNKRQQVWLKLTTNGYQSLRLAFKALETGNYTQCFTLSRCALEDWLVCNDCLNNEPTVPALLGSGQRVPTFKEMAQRLPDELNSLWKKAGDDEGTYGFLSTFSHPRERALQSAVNSDGTLSVFPKYDEIRFALAARFLLQNGMALLDFLARLADYLATPATKYWRNQNLKIVESKGLAALEAIIERLNGYLPKE